MLGQVLGFDIRGSSLVSFLPWLVMAVGSSLAGIAADAMIKKGMMVASVRKILQAFAFGVPAAACLVLASPKVNPQVMALSEMRGPSLYKLFLLGNRNIKRL